MNKINVDARILVAAIRYSLPRQTGMIDICMEELESNKGQLDKWVLERIAEEAESHLEWEKYSTEVTNKKYAFVLIKICKDEIERRCI